jgi:hypothetical protein
MTPLELATHYVALGLKVFPCRSRSDETIDPHTGEVTTLGEKTPLTANGFKNATRFQHIVNRWWEDWPDAAVGIPTGEAAGFFVLDIDNKPGGANGFEWLAEMEAEHGPLPDTARVSSPNGGLHIYFKYVAGTRNRGTLGAGADIRSEGGYVLAAGSVMSDGRAYRWSEPCEGIPPIADAPAWLLDLVVRKQAPATNTTAPTTQTNSAYVNAAVDRELADLASTGMGNRNNQLNDCAFNLGTFVGAGALPESEARALLQDVARGWGRDWARCAKTIENGLAAGQRSPREIPSAEHDNDNTRLVDVTRMIENGLRKAKERASKTAVEALVEPVTDEELKGRIENAVEAAKEQDAAAAEPADKPAILATAFKWTDPRKLPRREFAFGTHYIRKYVSVTVAPGGLGKTANSIVEALAMATNRHLTGTKPDENLNVWLFNSEDPRDELERRIMAACIRYKIKPEDIDGPDGRGRLFLDTGREQELVIAREDKKSGVRVVQPVVEAVVEQIKQNKIDVLIVDPFVSTHAVNENDNGAIDKVAKLWAQIADKTNCAIDIVHHLRKQTDGREATVEDARGAVALIGAARSVRILSRMSAVQAKEGGLTEQERFGYFSITHGKSNLTAMSSKADWRHLESVGLGNGVSIMRKQDFAPVVTEWHWPSMEKQLEAVPDEAFVAIKKRIGGGDYRYDMQAMGWAGIHVAEVLKLDMDDKAEKARVNKMLRQWEKDGHFTSEIKPDEKRMPRKYLKPLWPE